MIWWRSNPNLVSEILLRLFLLGAFLAMEGRQGFFRTIRKEEAWLYGYPHQDSFITTTTLWMMVAIVRGRTFFLKKKIFVTNAILSFRSL